MACGTQLHRAADKAGGSRVEIYSRDLRRVTGQFQEIAQVASGLADDVIFDGEIVALRRRAAADVLRFAEAAGPA